MDLVSASYSRRLQSLLGLLGAGLVAACASPFATHTETRTISSPFAKMDPSMKGSEPSVILRSKKGDRTLELELPAASNDLSDFEIPVSPDFMDNPQSLAANSLVGSENRIDDSYKDQQPTMTDQELFSSFQKTDSLDTKRRAIEDSLNLTGQDSTDPNQRSYLAKMDKVKQLYKLARFEAALLELDSMIRLFPMDSKLYEMRGTLLDRIGRPELAVRSWSQALEFDPNNDKLKKFIDKRQSGK